MQKQGWVFPVIFSRLWWPIEPKFSQVCSLIYKLWYTKFGPLANTVYRKCPMALQFYLQKKNEIPFINGEITSLLLLILLLPLSSSRPGALQTFVWTQPPARESWTWWQTAHGMVHPQSNPAHATPRYDQRTSGIQAWCHLWCDDWRTASEPTQVENIKEIKAWWRVLKRLFKTSRVVAVKDLTIICSLWHLFL